MGHPRSTESVVLLPAALLILDSGSAASNSIRMKKIILAVLLSATFVGGIYAWLYSRPGTPKEGRSYVVIVVDSLRADHVGAYGYERDTTPIADALAEDGWLVEQPLAQAPWTKPSVASIFTGTYTGVHRVLSAKRVVDGKPLSDSLSGKFVTMAEAVKTAGLATAGFGMKLHLQAKYGFDQGFDAYDMEVGDAPAIRKKTISWLRRREPDRFLIYLHYNDPHYPYRPPEEWTRWGNGDPSVQITGDTKRKIQSGAMNLSEAQAQELRDAYDSEILFNDYEIGKLLEQMDHRGYKNVMVIYTADHGEEFLDHGDITHGQSLYDELVRVPLIVGGTGLPDASRGKRTKRPIELIDIMPTILDMEGLPLPPFIQGRSFASALMEGADDEELEAHGYSQMPGAETVSDGRWKLIRSSDESAFQLFDLVADPDELNSLTASEAETAEALNELLNGWTTVNLNLFDEIQPQDTAPLDPEIEERLRSIGYVD